MSTPVFQPPFVDPKEEALPAPAAARTVSLSPNRRAWARFRRNRLGYVSLATFIVMLLVCTFAEIVSNDRPIAARYQGQWFFPIVQNEPETRFGGDFLTPTEWNDPLILEHFSQPGNWALHAPNRYAADTIDYLAQQPNPAAPSAAHWLGTDSSGHDMVARLIYGFRISIYFALVLTFVGTVLGIAIGGLQGYFGGRVDLTAQRVIEIWNAVPELYILIIVASIFAPSLPLLVGVFALFGWITLSEYVRAEFLRHRNLEFVKAARAMGLSNWQIIRRHVLPNSMTPVITFLPFRMSAAILFLTSLDFLGLGVTGVPSLGELLRQGKDNLDAWWISVPTFLVLVTTLLLLTFMGDALRDAFDPRKG